jgi:hypothetical protein
MARFMRAIHPNVIPHQMRLMLWDGRPGQAEP